jgi:hypothetical protein
MDKKADFTPSPPDVIPAQAGIHDRVAVASQVYIKHPLPLKKGELERDFHKRTEGDYFISFYQNGKRHIQKRKEGVACYTIKAAL